MFPEKDDVFDVSQIITVLSDPRMNYNETIFAIKPVV